MPKLTEATVTDAVVASMAATTDPRTREVLSALVRHLHAFIREVSLTEEEWLAAIRFLTATGQMCDDNRQEFIMLSDVLGASAMKDFVTNRDARGATEYSLLGPFYREGAPELSMDADIAAGVPGEPALVSGRVLSSDGSLLAGALIDVWQASSAGFYDVQGQDVPDMGLRGKFRTGDDGSYRFRTVKASSYPVPTDGPVGRLLALTGRPAQRPGHIHAIVSAQDHRTLITELFVEGDPCLGSDPVFGVRDSLIVPFTRGDSGYIAEYDFVLQRLEAR